MSRDLSKKMIRFTRFLGIIEDWVLTFCCNTYVKLVSSFIINAIKTLRKLAAVL